MVGLVYVLLHSTLVQPTCTLYIASVCATGCAIAGNHHLTRAIDTFSTLVFPQDTVSHLTSPVHQKKLSSCIDLKCFRSLLDASSVANKVCLHSVSVPHASYWLTVVPTMELGLHLDPSEFCVAIRWWLSVDISRGLSCPLCTDIALDPLGHHAATCTCTCRRGGDVVLRHNHLRDAFVELCHQAHLRVKVRKAVVLHLTCLTTDQPMS